VCSALHSGSGVSADVWYFQSKNIFLFKPAFEAAYACVLKTVWQIVEQFGN
jgi:hypothetical protein